MRGATFSRSTLPAQVDDEVNTLVFVSAAGEVQVRLGTHYYPLSAVGFAGGPDSRTGLAHDQPDRLRRLRHLGARPRVRRLRKASTCQARRSSSSPTSRRNTIRAASSRARALTPHGDIGHKAEVARRHGARLLIVVEDPAHVRRPRDERIVDDDPQIGDYRMPVIRANRSRLTRALGGRLDFDRLARDIDRTLEPRSQTVPDASVSYPERLAVASRVRNVIGVLKGSDPALATEAIVIGAHYDHLGSAADTPPTRAARCQIHNGADDNASGTALVIEMAHALSRQRVAVQPVRDLRGVCRRGDRPARLALLRAARARSAFAGPWR